MQFFFFSLSKFDPKIQNCQFNLKFGTKEEFECAEFNGGVQFFHF